MLAWQPRQGVLSCYFFHKLALEELNYLEQGENLSQATEVILEA